VIFRAARSPWFGSWSCLSRNSLHLEKCWCHPGGQHVYIRSINIPPPWTANVSSDESKVCWTKPKRH